MKDKVKNIVRGSLRVADKIITSGIIYNIKDENGAEKGKLDKPKGVRDFAAWGVLVFGYLEEILSFIGKLN